MNGRLDGILMVGAMISAPAEDPRWNAWSHAQRQARIDWVAVLAEADRLRLSAALAHALGESPLWPELDAELRLLMSDLRRASAQRSAALRSACSEIALMARDLGCQVLLLKGAADLFSGVDEPRGRRSMVDLDLLLAPGDVRPLWLHLQSRGYRVKNNPFGFDWRSAWHHAPPLLSPDASFCVELHRSALIARHAALLGRPDELWTAAMPLLLNNGVKVLKLPPTLDLIQRIAHVQLSHEAHQTAVLEVRHLFHVHLFIQQHISAIDWREVEAVFAGADQLPVLGAALDILERLFELSTPLSGIEGPSSRQHWRRCVARMNKPETAKFAIIAGQRLLTLMARDKLARLNDGQAPRNPREALQLILRRCAELLWRYRSPQAWRQKLAHLQVLARK